MDWAQGGALALAMDAHSPTTIHHLGDSSINAIDMDLDIGLTGDAFLTAYAADLVQQANMTLTPALTVDGSSTASQASPFLAYASDAAHDTLLPGKPIADALDWTAVMFDEDFGQASDVHGRMF